jgi:hypothetical protein
VFPFFSFRSKDDARLFKRNEHMVSIVSPFM